MESIACAGVQASISAELIASVIMDYNITQIIKLTLEKLDMGITAPVRTASFGQQFPKDLPEAVGIDKQPEPFISPLLA